MRNRELADVQTLVSRLQEADDDIKLGDYLHVLWVRRVWVAGCALAIAAAVAAQTLLSGRSYEATTMLAVSQSKIGDTEAAAVSAANFRPLIENHGIADAIIREFKLDQPPYDLTRSDFLGPVLTVEELRNTHLIQLRVRLDEPALAAKVANSVAAKAVDLARRLSQDEAVQARDSIKGQLDEAGKRLTEAEHKLAVQREAARLEVLKKDVEGLLDQRKDLMAVEVQIAGVRARLQRAEQELAKRQRFQVARRSIEGDPALMGPGPGAPAPPAASGAAPGAGGLRLSDEIPDQVYQTVDDLVASSRTELADLEKQREALLRSAGRADGKLPELTEMYRRETDVARLEVEHELAKRIYMDVAGRYQSARLQVAGRSAQLQVIDPALPPNHPLPRRTVARTAMGLIVGLVLGILGAFVREAIASAEQRKRATA